MLPEDLSPHALHIENVSIRRVSIEVKTYNELRFLTFKNNDKAVAPILQGSSEVEPFENTSAKHRIGLIGKESLLVHVPAL